jgi:hypothetical protein
VRSRDLTNVVIKPFQPETQWFRASSTGLPQRVGRRSS